MNYQHWWYCILWACCPTTKKNTMQMGCQTRPSTKGYTWRWLRWLKKEGYIFPVEKVLPDPLKNVVLCVWPRVWFPSGYQTKGLTSRGCSFHRLWSVSSRLDVRLAYCLADKKWRNNLTQPEAFLEPTCANTAQDGFASGHHSVDSPYKTWDWSTACPKKCFSKNQKVKP